MSHIEIYPDIEIPLIIKLAHIQSISEPNIFWLYSISDLFFQSSTIDFLYENRFRFKRKLTTAELFHYDSVIKHLKPKGINEFRILLKND